MKQYVISALLIAMSSSPLASIEQKAQSRVSLIFQEEQLSLEFIQLSQWLKKLQDGVLEEGEIETIWIGGGSARAILDHLYFGKPLVMRDLDVFAIADREVTREFVERIGQKLEAEDFGYFSRQDLRSRPRVPNDQPVLVRNDYVAGFGLHWLRPNQEILDLSVYHSKADLDLNGIFDVDTIMIPLGAKETLEDFAKRARTLSYDQLVQGGFVYDRYNGYAQWIQGKIEIVNWLDIESDPLLKVSRVIRTLNKMGRHEFTEKERQNFSVLMEGAEIKNPLQLTRGLLKLLEDDDFPRELQLLNSVGAFEQWLAPVKAVVSSEFFPDIAEEMYEVKPLAYGRGDRLGLARLQVLLSHIQDRTARLSAIVESTSSFDLDTTAKWMGEDLFNTSLSFTNVGDLDRAALETKLVRIAKSSVLSLSLKQSLYLRALVQGKDSLEAEKRLVQLFPQLDKGIVGRAAQESQVLRKGIITGVYNPVNLGHVEMMQESIDEMVLDELIVVLTNERGPFEKPVAWEDRYAMLSLASEAIPEIKLIPLHYKHKIKEEVEPTVALLMGEEDQFTQNEWIRILGSDMLKHWMSRGDWESLRPSYYQAFLVIQRGEDPFYPIENQHREKVLLKSRPSDENSHQYRHIGKKVRHLARSGKDLTSVVPKRVAEYIQQKKLYFKPEEEETITLITTNDRKHFIAKKVLGHVKQLKIDIASVQDISPETVVRKKLSSAMELRKEKVMVIESFVKIKALSDEFISISDLTLQRLGNRNLQQLLQTQGDEALFLTIVGYSKDGKNSALYSAVTKGKIDFKSLEKVDYFDVEDAFVPRDPFSLSAIEVALENLKIEQQFSDNKISKCYEQLFQAPIPIELLEGMDLIRFEARDFLKIQRIEKSSVLSEKEKQMKLLKVIFKRLPEEKRNTIFEHFKGAFPTLLEECQKPEWGFITGVFNPVHNGHIQAVKTAIEELALDQVIFLPTVATGHNEKPIGWEERVELLQLALQDEQELDVISKEFEQSLTQGTGAGIEQLFQKYPNTQWYQVMGSDSFERFVEQGRLDQGKIPLIVMQRKGHQIEVPELKEHHIYSVDVPNDLSAKERASSIIRNHLQSGKGIDHLVPPRVKEQIEKRGLYRN